ncbi:isovaleryl-CoA dehydrogenase [Piscinibacter sp.]|jgi:putative acyl-CoA dehydrogenase|uniref:isovaleryl-CoA dehydrogenase n=1 Tax=Piscinibacter sp. TaxID=1903157 RepID=UPI003559C311
MDVTHEVFNQPAPLAGYNLFEGNQPLRDALRFNAEALDTAELDRLGATLGTSEMQIHARLANVHTPQLRTHDRFGNRTDVVEFHPSYHALMEVAVGAGLHGTPWAGAAHDHVRRAAGFMLFTELEPSVLCPISMTYAVTPSLRSNPALAAEWGPRLTSRVYDSRFVPAAQKAGVTMGMGMTEKQGGSDVRANTTQAVRDGTDGWGERYRLVGHKWFMSAPMCDAFLVLAQTSGGLSCFFLPRWLPDGSVNAVRIQRLKDKLGNKANASSEVEFHGAQAWRVGDEGRGVPQILEMGNMTRLDCALGTSGLMRQALAIALHHTAQRNAFGKPLIAQPAMRNVLADLALESEAATALSLRLARTNDRPRDAHEVLMRRLLTPVAKFWICKRGSQFAQEAMECLGGNGYVEEGGEGVMARIYREMPVNSIWEGAGNIMALDLLRALRKGSDIADALAAELAPARGANAAFDRFASALPQRIDEATAETDARRLAQDVALAVQAALLRQHAPEAVFEAFCRSRLGGDWGQAFGTLPSATDFDSIIERAMPQPAPSPVRAAEHRFGGQERRDVGAGISA